MKPRKIRPVRAVTRVTDSDRSYKKIRRSSPQESPNNNNSLGDDSDRGGETGGQRTQSQLSKKHKQFMK
jgi:hypothetical protein